MTYAGAPATYAGAPVVEEVMYRGAGGVVVEEVVATGQAVYAGQAGVQMVEQVIMEPVAGLPYTTMTSPGVTYAGAPAMAYAGAPMTYAAAPMTNAAAPQASYVMR